jgi:hypothetical protein
MFYLKKRLELSPVIALSVTCLFSSACTAWHTTALEPQRFSAASSPERVRLTLSDGRQVTARHPVIVGDSLVWADISRGSPPDTARSAVLSSSIRQVKVHRYDAPRTLFLLGAVAGVVLGVRALIIGYANALY